MSEPIISDQMLSLIDEHLVAAVRKMGDSPEATKAWRSLSRMSREERETCWYAAFAFLAADGYILGEDWDNPHPKISKA
jgi:hypothetical protein